LADFRFRFQDRSSHTLHEYRLGAVDLPCGNRLRAIHQDGHTGIAAGAANGSSGQNELGA